MNLSSASSVLVALFCFVLFYQGCGGSFTALQIDQENHLNLNSQGHSGTKLYATHCASCHSPLSHSTKRGRSFNQISGAIGSIPNMAGLAVLSPQEIHAIADVLKAGTNEVDGIAYTPGKYLPTAEPLDCDPSKTGLAHNGTRRLTRKQMVNSLNSLFGHTGAMKQDSVLAAIELLPLDGDIGLVDGFDNRISYVEGLFTLADRITKYVFNDNTKLDQLLPTCAQDANSESCRNSLFVFAKRALRRPLSAAQKQDYLEFMGELSGPRRSLRFAVVRLLMSPRFHNLFENQGEVDANQRRRLDPYEIASRLSFGLTNHPPDEQLLAAAAKGQLSSLKQIEQHALRLIESPEAKEYFVEFLISMMRLETSVDPVPAMQTVLGIDPKGLSDEMTEEFKGFVEHVVFEKDASFYDLFNAQMIIPHSNRLAQFYNTGLSSTPVAGPAHRAGILMRPLVTKSGSIKSATIPRGVLMRKQLLCANLPSPDATIIGSRLQEIEKISELDYSHREIVAHVTSPQTCMSCHSQINPLGFVMESFGPFGEFREIESVFNSKGEILARHPVNTQVNNILIPGRAPSSVSSPKGLAEVLGDSPASMRCFSQQMFRFTRIRNAIEADACSLNQAANTLINGESVKAGIIKGIVNEDIFWRSSN